MAVLREANGIVGPRGAAARLGLPRTMRIARMPQLRPDSTAELRASEAVAG
ncbi:MAG TPA: hypothetical protein VKU01_09150 [Bryobacteraceae bacterium]|nr:hypothetical protein [Bryobacteraceae bacterium]